MKTADLENLGYTELIAVQEQLEEDCKHLCKIMCAGWGGVDIRGTDYDRQLKLTDRYFRNVEKLKEINQKIKSK